MNGSFHNSTHPINSLAWHNFSSGQQWLPQFRFERLANAVRWSSEIVVPATKQTKNEFSCAHSHNSRRSFVIRKSKGVAEERSSVNIHPKRTNVFCNAGCCCCCWEQLKGNVTQREVIFHWVNARRSIRCRRYTQFLPIPGSIRKMMLDFFLLSHSSFTFNYCSFFVVVIPNFFLLPFIFLFSTLSLIAVNRIMIRSPESEPESALASARARQITKMTGVYAVACVVDSFRIIVCTGMGAVILPLWNEWKDDEKKNRKTEKHNNITRKSITQVATSHRRRRWKWSEKQQISQSKYKQASARHAQCFQYY